MQDNTAETDSAVTQHTRLTHLAKHLANERTYLAYLRIFEPLFSPTKSGRGNRAGLSTVYRTIETMHGHVVIKLDVGKGTTIRLAISRAA